MVLCSKIATRHKTKKKKNLLPCRGRVESSILLKGDRTELTQISVTKDHHLSQNIHKIIDWHGFDECLMLLVWFYWNLSNGNLISISKQVSTQLWDKISLMYILSRILSSYYCIYGLIWVLSKSIFCVNVLFEFHLIYIDNCFVRMLFESDLS